MPLLVPSPWGRLGAASRAWMGFHARRLRAVASWAGRGASGHAAVGPRVQQPGCQSPLLLVVGAGRQDAEVCIDRHAGAVSLSAQLLAVEAPNAPTPLGAPGLDPGGLDL